MTDDLIVEIFFKNDKVIPSRTRESYLIKNEELYSYLKTRYKDSESIPETIWRIKLHIEERPVCPICGKEVQYLKNGQYSICCSNSCGSKYSQYKNKKTCLEKYGVDSYLKTKESKEKRKKTCLNKYGVDSYSKTKEYKDKVINTSLERYGETNYAKTEESKDKVRKTCLKKYNTDCYSKSKDYKEKCLNTNNRKYGTNYYFQSEDFKEKSKIKNKEKYDSSLYCNSEDFNEKSKKSIKEKYNSDYYFQCEDFKEKSKNTCKEKYGVSIYTKSNEYKDLFKDKDWIKNNMLKSYNTKKKNNSFNKSQPEDDLYKILLEEYPDTIRQYRSKVYPFNCDFYIPSKDLYIEYQGTWTHNNHAFDPLNENDINELNKWKEKSKTSNFYINAIETWTISDVKKRNIAKENNIKYLEIWNIDSIENIYNKINEYETI